MISRLKLERVKKQFSQEFLGKRANISQSRFSLIERGLQKPSAKEVKRLAEILGTKSSELFNAVEKNNRAK
jgi:transcriptional regulator with XRE-family HTH domain